MFPNGRDSFTCAVKKRAREKARYHREMSTPEGYARRRAKWQRQMKARQGDPVYAFHKRLHEMTRVRVR